MRRIAGAVGTAVLQILKWMLKIVLGALKLFLGLVRLVLLLFCLIAKEIDAVATALVEAFISNLEGKGDLEKAAATIAQGIKDYSTDKRGR